MPREITLPDGRVCILRPTAPEDAGALIRYMKETSGETDFLLRYPDEVAYTEEEERMILGRILDDPSSVMMVATVDGEIAGNCSISGHGARRKVRHRCNVAIALYRSYWHMGIGTAMMAYLTELAKKIGFTRMDLEVVAENARARALYAKCGFVESGRLHHAICLDDGTYHDFILMYREL
ncbi:MAG: GNAT family N-acetyltransferase [Clostridia bacterium]|nr:GNAT family N-acetyltransferase [Clostridia bacterium]